MSINLETLKFELAFFLRNNPNYIPGKSGQSLPEDFQGFVSESWCSGGITGGSCWGSEADTPVQSSPEKDIYDLDSFLETFYPQTSFLTYRKILSKVKYHDYSSYEYYGNSTCYKFKSISFEDILDCFSD